MHFNSLLLTSLLISLLPPSSADGEVGTSYLRRFYKQLDVPSETRNTTTAEATISDESSPPKTLNEDILISISSTEPTTSTPDATTISALAPEFCHP